MKAFKIQCTHVHHYGCWCAHMFIVTTDGAHPFSIRADCVHPFPIIADVHIWNEPSVYSCKDGWRRCGRITRSENLLFVTTSMNLEVTLFNEIRSQRTKTNIRQKNQPQKLEKNKQNKTRKQQKTKTKNKATQNNQQTNPRKTQKTNKTKNPNTTSDLIHMWINTM